MKKLVLFISFLFVVSLAFGQLLINEVDSDTPSYDTAEFIELYDGGIGNQSLDGFVVVLFNGSDDQSYLPAIDLDGYTTDANGYFVIGSTGMGTDIEISPGSYGWLQNGADAVALYNGDDTDFPEDTPVTTTNLIDALVYDTDDADDPGLLVLLNASEPQINENENGNKDTESMQRSPNGSGGARNTSTYTTDIPTTGTQNPDPPTTATLTRAYAMSTTSLDIVYDISITSVDPGDYSLTGT
ncbi:MAG: lamin tail domain-containing protein, partial [Candidatus Cloacimonetes bacterium]|nr:lamin tail domain-containing protein [Candidatus Cloacimonadota bacterium]